MFQIKICGITDTDDARAVARAGADAVGLNFYPKSPRYIDMPRARQIVDALLTESGLAESKPVGIVKVGLFVNADLSDVIRTYDELGLDAIQLHGDEPPEMIRALAGRPVVRAFRLDPDGLQRVATYLDRCRQLDCLPRMVLIDALVPGAYGGTGKKADWGAAKRLSTDAAFPPMVLAGGLTSDNVAEAIRVVGPRAVDTAGGVESSPGRKDPAAVSAFVDAARAALSIS